MKSWKKPTPEQVDRAVAHLGHKEQYRYFFDKLNNPEWIRPLSEKGYFKNPIPSVQNEERKSITLTPWPESRFLAKVASQAPEIVLDTILEMKETDNQSIHEDFAEAALKMPANLAAEFVKKEIIWLENQNEFYFVLFYETLGGLISHLSKGGEVETALELAKVILRINLDPNSEDRIKACFDDYQYEEILRKHYPDLLDAADMKAFDILCDLLKKAMEFYSPNPEVDDYSVPLRFAVEDHLQNIHHDIINSLISASRDGAELLVRNKLAKIGDIVDNLKNRRYSIFKRITLHLLRKFPDDAYSLIAEQLTDDSLFSNVRVKHEYSLLMNECYAKLDSNEQRTILNLIGDGPDTQILEIMEKPDEYKRIWQLKHLFWIKDNLPAYLKKYYDELIEEFGEPEEPFFEYRSKSFIGPVSPKSTEELEGMTVDDIVTFMKLWQPKCDGWSASAEGLGRVFADVVYRDPERFAVDAMKFKDLEPTYTRHLLNGLSKAVNNKRSFSWDVVLQLCSWVLQQPREIEGRTHNQNEHDLEYDPDRSWTHKTIAGLMQNGLQADAGCIPIEYRNTVWSVLEPITSDPNPGSDYDYESNMSPFEHAINSIRGEAMIAVIMYARWVQKNISNIDKNSSQELVGFKEIPEAVSILDEHLDINKEPTLTIRSIYGRFFQWLVLIDINWVKERISQIFNQPIDYPKYGITAWEAYITSNKAYSGIYDLLSEQYNRAFENIGKQAERESRFPDPDARLSEHMTIFYWIGKFELDSPDSPFNKFWRIASIDLKSHILSFIGKSLYDTKGAVDQLILDRLKKLCEK